MQLKRSRLVLLAMATAPFLGSGGALAVSNVKILTTLSPLEGSDSMVSHLGHVFVGVTRGTATLPHYTVLGYNPANGQIAFQVRLPHAPRQLAAYSATEVIAVGTDPKNDQSSYSIITVKNGKPSVKTKTIGINALAWAYVGQTQKDNYFIDLGGMSEEGLVQNRAGRTVFSTTKSVFTFGQLAPTFTTARIPVPVNGKPAAGGIVLIHQYSIGSSVSNATLLNPVRASHHELFKEPRKALRDFISLSGSNLLFSEAGADQLLLVDAAKAELKASIPVAGAPRSLAELGRCVLVGSETSRKIEVRAKSDLSAAPIETVDLSVLGPAFKLLHKIVVDQASGRVFAKSAYGCNPRVEVCQALSNAVAVALLADSTVRACK